VSGHVDPLRYFGLFRALSCDETRAARKQDLIHILRYLDGLVLRIQQCPAFNDVLDKLGLTKSSGGHVIAPSAFVLHIIDCQHFSIVALKHLIKDKYSRFQRIFVAGTVPRRLDEGRCWFRRNVPDFFWSS
jgi:hypothetical protein